MLKEWIVTLHRKEDLEGFYEDMETPGGSLYIPERNVDVALRRSISRNTHYLLAEDEAELVRQDPRVWDVADRELVDSIVINPAGWKVTNGQFDRDYDSPADPNDINWGLLRHVNVQNLLGGNWGNDGTKIVNSDLTVTSSGKNVDVLIVDGHVDPNHPEMAVNPDGTGSSRVVQYNWFQHTAELGLGSNGTYTYTPYTTGSDPDLTGDNNHGVHVAGTVAGNTQGWARDANIYNISPYGSNPNWGVNGLNSATMWDYIRAWHNSKPINPVTGRRNPTVSNHSYVASLTLSFSSRIIYRGVDYNKGSSLTWDELRARGVYVLSTGNGAASDIEIPYYFTSRFADIEDAFNDGVLGVCAAGNESFRIVDSNDQDYNNFIFINGGGSGIYTNRGTGAAAAIPRMITVGSLDFATDEYKSSFSNTGSLIDIFAAGTNIISSLHTPSAFGTTDPRDFNYYLGEYQGTSMASPQVCGICALLLEHFPNMSQDDMSNWIKNTPVTNQMSDTGTDNAGDVLSLQGAENKLVYWENIRPEDGSAFPMKKFRERPTSGKTYPRPRVRRRG